MEIPSEKLFRVSYKSLHWQNTNIYIFKILIAYYYINKYINTLIFTLVPIFTFTGFRKTFQYGYHHPGLASDWTISSSKCAWWEMICNLPYSEEARKEYCSTMSAQKGEICETKKKKVYLYLQFITFNVSREKLTTGQEGTWM